uniref:Uncharacterized protein n=1 Tax=Molossus molossus TaxID=27622 RepID=A0A7J8C8S5_MOLMO|nr:hypothetical protein HJG59_009920 [Molossus molossus]
MRPQPRDPLLVVTNPRLPGCRTLRLSKQQSWLKGTFEPGLQSSQQMPRCAPALKAPCAPALSIQPSTTSPHSTILPRVGGSGEWVWLRCCSLVQTPLSQASWWVRGQQNTAPRCPRPKPPDPGPCAYMRFQDKRDLADGMKPRILRCRDDPGVPRRVQLYSQDPYEREQEVRQERRCHTLPLKMREGPQAKKWVLPGASEGPWISVRRQDNKCVFQPPREWYFVTAALGTNEQIYICFVFDIL